MPGSDLLQRRRAMDQLTREFDRLSAQQCEAMKKAVFAGMTSDEAMEYDKRHRKIAELVKKMEATRGSESWAK